MIPDHIYNRRKVAFWFDVEDLDRAAFFRLQEHPLSCLKPGYKNLMGWCGSRLRPFHIQFTHGMYRNIRRSNKKIIVVFNIHADLYYGSRPATFRDLQGDVLNEVEILGGVLAPYGTPPEPEVFFTKSHTMLFEDPKTYQVFCSRLHNLIGKDTWRVSRHVSRKLACYVRDKERAEARSLKRRSPLFLNVIGLGDPQQGLRNKTRLKFEQQGGVFVTFYLHDDIDAGVLDREYFLMKLKDAKRKA